MCVFAFYIKIIITFYEKKINLSIWQILLCSFVSFVQEATTCATLKNKSIAQNRWRLRPINFFYFFTFFVDFDTRVWYNYE